MASLKSCGVKIFVSSCLTLEKSAKLGRVGSGGVVGTVRGIASNTLKVYVDKRLSNGAIGPIAPFGFV